MTLHTIIETNAYLADADDAGMGDDERADVVTILAADPRAGAIMPGCGGARKLRVRRSGGGKSGGWRVITYYGGDDVPVFLLTAFAKGEKDNLSKGGTQRTGGADQEIARQPDDPREALK